MKAKRHLRLGDPDTDLTAPSHVAGVPEGNRPGGAKRSSGLRFTDGIATATARRSTGVGAEDREPVDPNSPRLTPS